MKPLPWAAINTSWPQTDHGTWEPLLPQHRLGKGRQLTPTSSPHYPTPPAQGNAAVSCCSSDTGHLPLYLVCSLYRPAGADLLLHQVLACPARQPVVGCHQVVEAGGVVLAPPLGHQTESSIGVDTGPPYTCSSRWMASLGRRPPQSWENHNFRFSRLQWSSIIISKI